MEDSDTLSAEIVTSAGRQAREAGVQLPPKLLRLMLISCFCPGTSSASRLVFLCFGPLALCLRSIFANWPVLLLPA